MNLFVALLVVVLYSGEIHIMLRQDGNKDMVFKTKEACEKQVKQDMPELQAMLDGKVQQWAVNCIPKSEWDKVEAEQSKRKMI